MNVMTVAVKFCGGCDSLYDRLQYWEKIREAAAGRIRWTSLDCPGVRAVLLICGCRVSCPEKHLNPADYEKFVSLTDDGTDPDQVIKKIVE